MMRNKLIMCSEKNRSRAGFTLIEIMLVIVILGMLVAVAGVAVKNKTKRAGVVATRTTLAAISSALDAYEVDMGVYPSSLQELLTSNGNSSWQGPYLKGKELPVDAWGNQIQYTKQEDSYELRSLGPDGVSSSDDITSQ